MRGLAVAVVLALAWAAPAAARPLAPSCTDTFQVVGASRDWNTAANWTNGVPTPADDVCILAGIPQVGTATPVIRSLYAPNTPLALTGDFTVTGAATVQSLAVSAGTVSVGGPLTVAGELDLGGGTVTSAADGTIGDLVWSGGTLAGAGTTTVTGTGTLVGGTLTGRTLRLAGASTMSSGTAIAGTGTLVAAAPLTVHAPATIGAPFTATAAVSVDGGVLTLTRAELDGQLTIASTGGLDLGDGANVTGAGTLTNAGTLRKSAGAGTVTIAVPVSNQGTVDVEGGTLSLASLNDGTLGSGTYVLAGQLLVPGLHVTANAATIRLGPSGGLSGGAGDALAGLAANTGTLDLGGHDLALTGDLANSGTVRLGGATLTTAGSYVQSAGLTSLDGGTLHAGTPVEIRGGRLEGTGTVIPGLLNAATVAPGTPLTVTGDYVQTPSGTLAAPPGGLAVTGTATLGGTLAVDPAAVSDGATLPLLTAAAVTGQWAAPPATPDYTFAVGYGATGATLTAHKIPSPVPCVTNCGPVPCCDGGGGGGVETASGTVLIKLPGTNRFTPLAPGDSVPVGSVVDARNGTLSLSIKSKFDPAAPPTRLSVAAAIFKLQQDLARDRHTTVTSLVVQTPAGLAHACVPRKGVRRSRHATIRRLRATVFKGVVRALGKAAVLTTRNASFSMRDRCDGTSTRVVHGKGTVFDRVTGRRAHLRAHQAYVARTKLFQIRQARLRKIPKP